MRADIEQDIDGKLWLLVDGPDGQTYKISHEAATATPDLPPPIQNDPESVKWSAPGYAYWSPPVTSPITVDQWKACII